VLVHTVHADADDWLLNVPVAHLEHVLDASVLLKLPVPQAVQFVAPCKL
jgi:hypothetical protein